MQIVEEYKYSVVQFLKVPYADIGDYICVPSSWIKIRGTTDRKIVVAYPNENPLFTKERVKRGDKVLKEWKFYNAVIKYETNYYEDADNFIMMKKKDASTWNKFADMKNTNYEELPAAAKNTSNFMQIILAGSQVDKSQVTVVPTTNIFPKRSDLSKRDLNNYQNKIRVFKKARSPNEISNLSESFEQQAFPNNEPRLFDQRSVKVSVIDKHPYSQNNTENSAFTVMNLTNQFSQGTEHSHKKPLFSPLPHHSPRDSCLQKIIEQTNETKSNKFYQWIYESQKKDLSSIHQNYFRKIALRRQRIERIKSNPKDLLSNFTEITPFAAQKVQDSFEFSQYSEPVDLSQNLAKFSQIPEPLLFSQDFPQQVPYSQETPARQYSVADNVSHTLGFQSRTMNDLLAASGSSNSTVQSTCTEFLHKKQFLSNDSSDTLQDTCMENMTVDGSTEANCIEQSIHSEKNTKHVSFAIPKSLNEMNPLCQSIQCSMEKGIQTVDKGTENVSSIQEVDKDEQSCSTKSSTGQRLIANQNSDEHQKKSIDSHTNFTETWLDQWADLFGKMNTDLTQTCKAAENLRDLLLQSAQTVQCIVNTINDFRNLKKNDTTAAEPEEFTVKVQKQAEEQETKLTDENVKEDNEDHSKIIVDNNDDDYSYQTDVDDDEDEDENEDKDTEAPKKSRGHIRTFVLPPEYDPDDTKWTLKYREPESTLGLTELIPRSGVFVNAIKLAYCKQVSKDCKALARMLLVEIFSQSALSVCSLTGAKANAFNTSGTNVRPGLNEHARMVLLQFVEEYGCKKGWCPFDIQSVMSSIRSKIQEIRAKYG